MEHFSLKTVLTIGICLVDRLQNLHDRGYLHCDIKPDNVMIGDFKHDRKEMEIIYLIDFGLAMSYLDKNGKHIPLKSNVPFRGNVVFASKHAFSKVTQSRRDDVIALAYLLYYLIDTNLKWFDNTKDIKG